MEVDSAVLTKGDFEARNGVVHLISEVLIPPPDDNRNRSCDRPTPPPPPHHHRPPHHGGPPFLFGLLELDNSREPERLLLEAPEEEKPSAPSQRNMLVKEFYCCVLLQLVQGDETWVYNFDPETKRQSTLWCSSKSPPSKKIRRARSVGKQMIERRKTVNSDWYTTKCLPAVFEKIKQSRQISHLRGVLLHHGNAIPHTSAQTFDFLANSGVQLVTHPTYSPDLAAWDFFYY
ncbi:hypothetical protein LAZ67_18001492 [Cordylochernes scorpioides]|uniref:FAS1 domain-containing protein n=1 Tax=Cordylochernes scorpioides TaxID=51811 RepID=A0ABY6LK20_9ARAC|nr:hypothetical protein LAZ67_18001492 [Cordylochernes scorpioides]